MTRIIKILTLCLLGLLATAARGQTRVFVLDIKSEIDPRTTRYVKMALAQAERTQADILLIEMDTYGGILTDAKEIVDMLMDVKKPLWVFINSDAASAGALISIACDSIYMAPGATIGAATVVSGSGEAAPDKYQSYMRSIMRSTAEEKGRNPRIAEAMVDASIEIDSITLAGQVITFSTSEALKYGFCEAKVTSIEEILARNNIENYTLQRFELGSVDQIIAFFLNPFISGLLILIIIGGIYFELQTPGVGFPLIASIVALVLYLVPYYLSGLAQYWEIFALLIGIVLVALEIFVIPGFGVAGILGISLTLMSMVLIMLNNDFFDFEFVPMGDLVSAILAAAGGVLGGAILLFVGGARLTKTKAFQRIALMDTQDKDQGFTVGGSVADLIGRKGIAQTVLRPSGKVFIDQQLFDAYTRGEFIDKGERIEVVGVEGASLRVKKSDA